MIKSKEDHLVDQLVAADIGSCCHLIQLLQQIRRKLDDIRSSRTQMQEEAERTAIEQGILIEAEENAKVLIWALMQSDSDLSNYTPIWKTITEEVE